MALNRVRRARRLGRGRRDLVRLPTFWVNRPGVESDQLAAWIATRNAAG